MDNGIMDRIGEGAKGSEGNHQSPAFATMWMPRPGDRETRMHPAPGKWIIRSEGKKEEAL